MVISQAARTLLDVGFEMKDRVAVFRVSGAGDLGEVLYDGVPLAQGESRKQLPFETLVERQIAADKTAVEERDGEFQIVGIDSVTFLQRACGGAGAEADIPHRLGGAANGVVMVMF